jgi:hypothetical protein
MSSARSPPSSTATAPISRTLLPAHHALILRRQRRAQPTSPQEPRLATTQKGLVQITEHLDLMPSKGRKGAGRRSQFRRVLARRDFDSHSFLESRPPHPANIVVPSRAPEEGAQIHAKESRCPRARRLSPTPGHARRLRAHPAAPMRASRQRMPRAKSPRKSTRPPRPRPARVHRLPNNFAGFAEGGGPPWTRIPGL